jgi:hypothetical protein
MMTFIKGILLSEECSLYETSHQEGELFMKRRNRVVLWCAVFAVILSMGMTSHPACAGTATGYLTVDNERIEFTHAYAAVKPNWEDETLEDIVVILTDYSLSDEAIENERKRSDPPKEKGIEYVELTIEPDQWTSLNIRMVDGLVSVSGGILELKVFDEKRVEGRFYTDGEKESAGSIWAFDFTFQAEIRRPEEAPQTSESAEEPEAETTENDEDLSALSPEEKFERTVADMQKFGMVFGFHQVDLNYFPICPSGKDVSEIEFGKSEWAAPSWDEYKDFYTGNFKDAWGTPFKYVSTDDGSEYTLTSYGADKAKGDGGGEFDADIVYSNGWFVAPPRLVQE